ncbi:ArgA [Laribacter hongkongensis HLHK9]|uniref:Amino-acid acetyltransferase n=1 Tax=Laribacter hongkongensis (strain HLHK9) TaxID=557598 RepID=C1DDB5_LARHH|nr:amino-acid N-acetyltransferase [Laribacter hongkongensis]ACO75747.1 ArgA [Laribacter hongkongensis HLHK9]
MYASAFVQSFREAAPYIHAFRGRTFVIGFGGEALEQGRFASLSHDINLLVSLGVKVVLVHGARPQIDGLLKIRGITPRIHLDRRVTDSDTIEIVKQAVGWTRAEIEAQLSVALPDSPMAGANLRIVGGNHIVARPLGVIDGVDMQYSGQVRKLDVQAIRHQLDFGELVLLSPLGYSPTGEIFNLSMPEVAAAAAAALHAEKLLFVLDTPSGVQDENGRHITEFTAREGLEWLDHSARHLGAGMRHCLKAALDTVISGVKRAHIVSQHLDGALLKELFTHDGCATMISAEPLQVWRQAVIEDVGSILALIEPLERSGALVKRGRELIEMDIHRFYVIEHDGKITGCVALNLFPENHVAELACLAVLPAWQKRGQGDALLRHTAQKARQLGMKRLFVLTTQTAHWFIERGFAEGDLSELPERKQALYNYQRRSKVLFRNL